MGRSKGSKNRPTLAREEKTTAQKQSEEILIRPYLEHLERPIDVKQLVDHLDNDLATPTIDSPMVAQWEEVGDFATQTRELFSKFEEITGQPVVDTSALDALERPTKRPRTKPPTNRMPLSSIEADEIPARSGGRGVSTSDNLLPPDLEDIRAKILRYYTEFPHMIDDKTVLYDRRWTGIQLQNELERCRRALQPAATFQFLRQAGNHVLQFVETVGCHRGMQWQSLAQEIQADPEYDLCLRQIMVEYNLDFSKLLRPELRLAWLIYGATARRSAPTASKKNDAVAEFLKVPITLPPFHWQTRRASQAGVVKVKCESEKS